jgi:hypothetical protein
MSNYLPKKLSALVLSFTFVLSLLIGYAMPAQAAQFSTIPLQSNQPVVQLVGAQSSRLLTDELLAEAVEAVATPTEVDEDKAAEEAAKAEAKAAKEAAKAEAKAAKEKEKEEKKAAKAEAKKLKKQQEAEEEAAKAEAKKAKEAAKLEAKKLKEAAKAEAKKAKEAEAAKTEAEAA